MFNPLKDFFSPKFVVGLEIKRDSIGAVQVFNSLKGPEIDQVGLREIRNHEHIHQELRDFFRDKNLKPEMLVTSLSASSAFIREVPPPLENSRKLHKIIKYQMEPFVPYPIEDMVVDFLPHESNENIITISVEKKVLSDHLKSLSSAGLEPGVVSLDNLALYFLYCLNPREEADKPVSIIHIDREKKVIQVINRNRLDFIRILPGGTDDQGLIKDTFRLYQLKRPDVRLGEILLTGPSVMDGDFAETMGALTRIKTSIWRPFDEIRYKKGEVGTDLQAKLSVPLSLAMSIVNPPAKAFDLRKEAFAIKTSMNLKKMFLFMFFAIFLLGSLFSFHIYQRLNIQETYYQELKTQIRQIFMDTFPETKIIIKGQEFAQMRQKIEQETAQYQWLDEFSEKGAVLDILKILTKTISGYKDARIDNFSMEAQEIHLDGRTSSFETVDRLKEKLTNTNYFRSVRLVGAKMDKKTNSVKFNFALERSK
ncbi:MAG: pilus assembly protein PilM [Thermodesulfobacteriota bacterium]|nr:pilus assembly protein PilM [Thermodesulfobacteriota bacterium]